MPDSSMLLSLLAIVGFALVVLALGLHFASQAARRRRSRKTAQLIRMRLQDEPREQRTIYREIPIRLSGN